MKIGLLHHQIIRATAVETFLMEFGKRLAAAGHEPVYITTLTTPEIGVTLPGRWELLPRVRGGHAIRMWHFNRAAPLAAVKAGVDVTIGFGRTTAQDIHRNATGCHALYGHLLPPWQRYTLRHLYELRLERQLYTGSATRQFVMSSARVAAQIQGIYRTQGDLFRTLPPPVETHLFKPAADRANVRELTCRKLQTDPDKPVLLFVSLSHRHRGLEPLLEAMKSLPATLWIAGKGLNAAMHERTVQMGISDRIRSVPITSNLVELYQSADWFVHPTQYDAFSNTVLQSMACGLPGIVSVMDGAVDHVRNGENGFMLYHPQNATELAARIQEALALTQKERTAMSQAARESVLSLTWEHHMLEWESHITEVAGR